MPLFLLAVRKQVAVPLADVVFREGDVLPRPEYQLLSPKYTRKSIPVITRKHPYVQKPPLTIRR